MKRGLGKKNGKSLRSHIERLESRQLLSASLAISSSQLIFNAVKGSSASQTETLTFTDTGASTLSLGKGAFTVVKDPSVSTNDVARFSLLNASSTPASLNAGQSFSLQVNYSATAIGINSAFLDIATNDAINPLQAVSLRGIGTAGLGGSNQPSLATILRAYDIPTIVGEGKNDANAASDSIYPNPPDASSQEVALQRLVKAGAGPVSIQVLASFTASGAEPYTLGTYNPGNPGQLNQLFFTPSSEYQSTYVQPQGATSFDPGSSQFGFYFISNVQVKGRVGYSEDALNTWDTTNNRKFRFFPLENADGSVVPNAYIMTSTEWNAPAGYDFTNIVAIVRNVKAAPGAPTGPALTLVNTNALPGSSTMVFSRIQSPNTSVGDTEDDTGKLQVTNSGTSPLIVSSYSLSSAWTLVSAPSFPLSIAVGATVTLSIRFDATSEPSVPYNETSSPDYPSGGGVYTGNLVLNTNDPNHASDTVALAGWWQYHSENSNEPSLQTITNLLEGWSTNINSTPISELTESSSTSKSSPTYYGEEVVSAYWNEADTSQNVTVQQIAGYHTEGNTAITSWYTKGSTSLSKLFATATDDGQTLFPDATGTSTPAAAAFSTTNSFGFDLDGEYSDDSKNTKLMTGGGHHVRFYPVRDAQGNLVPNTYIMTMDYSNSPQNFDFQDNVYLVSNIRPSTGTAAPTDLRAVGGQGGNSVQWAPVTDSTLKGYNVYRSLSASGSYSLLTSTPITTNSFFDSSAPSGKTAYYRVTAIDNAGLTESLGTGASAIASGTTPVTPAAPANFSATGVAGAVSLTWSAVSDPTLQGYNVYGSSSATGTFSLLTASPITATSYTDLTAPVGSVHYYKVTAIDAGSGLESAASTANATALTAATGLQSVDIGASPAGSTTVVTASTDFNVTAGGPGVAANADGFRFIYQSQTGNFDVKVQVLSLTVAGNYSTAGIMARSTLGTTSPDVYMSASPVNYRFKERDSVGGVNNIVVGSNTSYPNVWVRLSRVGNLFTGYTSTDGINWTQVSSITLALPTTLSLGLAVASNTTTSTTTAQLRDYSNTFAAVTPVAPPAPTNFTATGVTNAIDLAWASVADSTLKGYNVYRSTSATGTYTLLTSSPITATSLVDSAVTAGVTMYYHVTAVDATSGLESTTTSANAAALAVVATGLQSIDIGASTAGSTTVVTTGTDFNVTAGGPGVAGNVDGFRFIYQSQTGNFDVKVQVTSLTVAGNYSTAGIMARSTLDTTSPDVYMSASPVNYRFKERATVNGVNNIVVGANTVYPNVWVRLARVGNVFTGYSSSDGLNWTQVSSITLSLPTTLSLGLAVASNSTTATTTAQLRDYSNTVTSTPVPPAAPTNLVATPAIGSISLGWSAVADTTLKGYNVYSSNSASGDFTLLTATPITATSYNLSPTTAGVTTYFHVTAVDASSGLESTAASTSAASLAAAQTLTSVDIGATPDGSTTVSNGTYTVVAGGPGVTANSDGFRYLYTAQTGNFDVKVQVSSITVAGNFATAGIMARSTLDADSANVYMSATPANYRFKDRTATDGTTNIVASGTPSYPNVWVRLQRIGNVFTGYLSTDGVNWTVVSTATVALPATIDLGLAVASNVTTMTTTAVMQNYGNT